MGATNNSSTIEGCNMGSHGDNSLITIVFMFISITTITINTLIIILYSRRKFTLLVNRPANRLLFSLAICDLLSALGLVGISVILFNMNMGLLPYRILLDVYETFLVKTLIFHLCGLTLDRYIGLFYALRYNAIVTAENVKRYIVVSWFVPFVASGVQLTWLYKKMKTPEHCEPPDPVEEIFRIEFLFSLISFVVFLALPTILLAVIFFRMIVEIQRIVARTPGRTLHGCAGRHSGASKLLAGEKRSTYIYSLMYLSFVVLAMPYYALRLKNDIEIFMKMKIIHMPVSPFVSRLVVSLKYSTSIIRPALYAFSSVELRTAAAQLLKDTLLRRERRYGDYSIAFSKRNLRTPVFDVSGSTNSFDSKDDFHDSSANLHRTIK